MGGGRGGDSGVSAEVTAWVQKHGTAVDTSEYDAGSSSDSDSDSDSDSGSGSGSGSRTSGTSGAQNSQAIYPLDASDVN